MLERVFLAGALFLAWGSMAGADSGLADVSIEDITVIGFTSYPVLTFTESGDVDERLEKKALGRPESRIKIMGKSEERGFAIILVDGKRIYYVDPRRIRVADEALWKRIIEADAGKPRVLR